MKATFVLLAALLAPTLAAQARDSTINDAAVNPRARLFVARKCADCHGLEALNVRPKANVGPDLTSAYADVPARYSMPLERFFDEPAGFMRVILGQHIQLTRSDADSLVRLFHDLYKEHLARVDSLRRQARPVRGGGTPPSRDERK